MPGPDFFIVGHPKCGTTALYRALVDHPDVYMAPTKEPWFFVSDAEFRSFNPGLGGRMSLAEYLALFDGAGAERRRGEATPAYLRSDHAAEAIAAFDPAARVVAIVREPADLVWSWHLHLLRTQRQRTADLREALAAEDGLPPMCRYSGLVRFTEQLERFDGALGAGQVLVILHDDYRRDGVATLRRVLDFLGVDAEGAAAPADANPSVALRSASAARALGWLAGDGGRAARALRRTTKAVTTPAMRERARGLLVTPPPPVDADLQAELRLRFAPEVRKLSDHLGRDLCSLWGYHGA